jgi:hypothetical protein
VDPLHDRVNQVEHRLLRPVEILQHHDERTICGQNLKQATHGPGGIRRAGLAAASYWDGWRLSHRG